MARLPAPPTFKRAEKTEAAIDAAIISDNGNRFRGLLLKHLPLIADAYRKDEESGAFRSHLGASTIGGPCDRRLWLSWRWSFVSNFPPRILRLFNRGHQEEARFLALLEMIGVQFHQPENGDQERISDFGGHFGSALDGVLYGVPECPTEWILGEFKTHGTKPFCELVNKGVKVFKPDHYAQMQTCMARRGIFKTLYLAVNKNDDALFAQIIEYDKESADRYLERARTTITRRDAPARISADPSYMECSYCSARSRCHYPEKEALPKNCRTCKHSVADLGGTWGCEKHNIMLDKTAQRKGCADWDAIQELAKR